MIKFLMAIINHLLNNPAPFDKKLKKEEGQGTATQRTLERKPDYRGSIPFLV